MAIPFEGQRADAPEAPGRQLDRLAAGEDGFDDVGSQESELDIAPDVARVDPIAPGKYATNLDDNAVNLPELECHLRGIAPNVEPLEADAPDFPTRLRALLELVMNETSAKPPRITLDISVTANRLLLRCMSLCVASR